MFRPTSELRQSRRNTSTIKARKHCAEGAFDEQALDGARHVRGLVELVTDSTYSGSTDWKGGRLALDSLDDRECGASARLVTGI